ncbi:hypothetical protein E3N88_21432 [Mikania micrantha]|uniref:Uncharacterized protein n=1 Tax=Mikania micrantha TaxID=192012 RepID=A0A5N6NL64_9ASTR|nr:hypothetical protein E3N88_21432 [Mikania micrantha]
MTSKLKEFHVHLRNKGGDTFVSIRANYEVLCYQNKIEALTLDDDKTLRDKKSKDNDGKADEMQLEMVMEDDK